MNNALAITPLENIERHLLSPQVMVQFTRLLERRAAPYIQSVMIAVENNTDLQKCSPESIAISALRAASLELSCDPAVKQAYLIPRWNGRRKAMEAQFQPHYLGLYNLAMRTRKYIKIEVIPFPAGWDMLKDLNSGEDIIVDESQTPRVFAPKTQPQEAGNWYGYLRDKYGNTKKIWMSKEEIHLHAKTFNPKGYGAPGSLWQNPDQCHTMEMKTVLRELLNWADKSGTPDPLLHAALQAADDVIDVETEDVPAAAQEPDEYDQLPAEWAKPEENPDPIDDDTWSKWERLAEKARALALVVPNVDRAKTPKADLIEEWKLLSDKVKKAGAA